MSAPVPCTRAQWREWIRRVNPGEVRRRAGVRQGDLAGRIGVDPTTLSGWETGGGVMPRKGGREWFEAVTEMLAAPVPRLTFPAYDIGSADILVGGKHAGVCLAEFWVWRAYLYSSLSSSRIRAEGCEEVTGRTLGELRRVLRDRVELKGPWWTD